MTSRPDDSDLKLYWVQSRDNASARFVVARTAQQAREHFEQTATRSRGESVSRLVLYLPKKLQSQAGLNRRLPGGPIVAPCWPSDKVIKLCGGIHVRRGAARVVHLGGTTYAEKLLEAEDCGDPARMAPGVPRTAVSGPPQLPVDSLTSPEQTLADELERVATNSALRWLATNSAASGDALIRLLPEAARRSLSHERAAELARTFPGPLMAAKLSSEIAARVATMIQHASNPCDLEVLRSTADRLGVELATQLLTPHRT